MIQFPRKIRDRVLLVAALPVVIVTLLLVLILSSQRLGETADALEQRGEIITLNLALTSEFGLFSGDVDALNRIVDTFFDAHTDIHRIDILDSKNEVKIVRYRNNENQTHSRWLSKFLSINPIRVFEASAGALAPVASPLLEEYPVNYAAMPEALGTVRVILSDQALVASERQVLEQGMWLLIAGVALSLLLAIPIGATITHPLQRLLKLTRDLRQGNTGARVTHLSTGEFGALEKGFNALADDTHRTQVHLQKEIDSATDELSRTIQELTARNRELGSARTAAMAAAEEKEAFLARMSHEIRTPLNAIIGFSRILERDHSQHHADDYIHVINQASTQLLFLVNDILQYSRIKAGHLVLDRQRFNLAEKIENLVAMVSHQAHENDLELISLIHSDVPEFVTGDPDRIGQILLNLLNNALKFTHEGHVFLEVAGPAPDSGEQTVQFRISDTGPGIEPEFRENLFEPFFQGEETLTRKHGGAGLGLAIAKRLATAMGGDIEVASKPGPGAKFLVSIPLPASGGASSIALPTPQDGPDIYLYEAHPLSRRALRVMLSRHGRIVCNTDRFDHLVEQLDAAQEPLHSAGELVVIGLQSRVSLAHETRANHARLRKIFAGPLLYVVSKDSWQPGSWVSDGLHTDWISKPARRTTLAEAVDRILEKTTDQPSGESPPPSGHRTDARNGAVLYIEDNAFNRELFGHFLGERGFKMDALASGTEINEQTLDFGYRMIFTDLHLPDTDGATVARHIRNLLGEKCPPIVLVTADALHQDALQRTDGPFDDALTKPVSEAALDQVLTRWTGEWFDGGSPEPPASDPGLENRLKDEQIRLMDRIRLALDSFDFGALRDNIHQLKGLSGLGENTETVAILREMEERVDAGAERRSLEELLDRLTRHLQAFNGPG